MDKLIEIIVNNPRLSLEDLAAMLDETKEEVAKRLDELKDNGTIRGFRTLVDWTKLDVNKVNSIILLNVRPVKDAGFDEVAKKIANMDEVESVLLMSGGYDLLVEISGDSFQSIAEFVAKRLSPMDSVLSTSTHFVLKTYKRDNSLYIEDDKDYRIDA